MMTPVRRRGIVPGYSMIEMIIAILILGVLGSIASTAIAGVSSRYSLESAADQLAADLQRSRIEAIRRNTAVSLTVTSTNGYDLEFGGARELPEDVVFTTSPAEVRFASFGPVLTGSATFVLQRGNEQIQVLVTTAGHVAVVP